MDMNQVSFVTGVDRWGARPPAGFPHRFAVLSWVTIAGEDTHPWRLLRLVAPGLVRLSAADTAVAEFWHRSRSLLLRRNEKTGEAPLLPYLEWDERLLEQFAAFPDKVRFERRGEVVLWMETEFGNAVGGPAPYADSVTLSFFSASDLSGELEQLFQRGAVDAGADVVGR